MKTTLVALLATVLVTGCGVLGQRTGEEALFSTLSVDENFEVRLYEPLIVAQTVVEGPYLLATRTGYQRLTNYVSGNNLAQQTISANPPSVVRTGSKSKVELTVPYYEEYLDGSWLVSVAMPEAYSLNTLPKPVDDTITFTVLPRLKVAVVRFMGYRSQSLISKKADALTQWMRQNRLSAASPARSAIYDSPWAIPMLRRHEIHISVK